MLLTFNRQRVRFCGLMYIYRLSSFRFFPQWCTMVATWFQWILSEKANAHLLIAVLLHYMSYRNIAQDAMVWFMLFADKFWKKCRLVWSRFCCFSLERSSETTSSHSNILVHLVSAYWHVIRSLCSCTLMLLSILKWCIMSTRGEGAAAGWVQEHRRGTIKNYRTEIRW